MKQNICACFGTGILFYNIFSEEALQNRILFTKIGFSLTNPKGNEYYFKIQLFDDKCKWKKAGKTTLNSAQ